ncbi:MAG TPA: GvpL/GvpF family gas vesicle protein [Pseudonocardiaceae bacterium]|nr:GvpL/GvpF family gas vesicle protein [Pseudonocardiaceae bacterium]
MAGDAHSDVTGDLIDELGRRYAPQALADAVAQARSLATAELTERLTRAILARAVEPAAPRTPTPEAPAPSAPAPAPAIPTPTAPAPAAVEPSAPSQPAEHGLWAYVITRDHALDVVEPPESTPYLISHRGLGLVVSEMELSRLAELDTAESGSAELAEDSPLATLVRQHDSVVRAVFDRKPVLPLRFGTVVADEDAAVRLLRARHDEVAEWLDRVDGQREWGVRARLPADDTPAEPPEPTPTEGISGTEYLALRQNRLAAIERSRGDRAGLAAAARDTLARQATDSARRDRLPGLLLDDAYLVATANEPAFHGEVQRLAEELGERGVTVELTGPWPPYSFADLELSAESGLTGVTGG